MKKNSPFSPKEAWINASITGADLKNGTPILIVQCFHHQIDEFVSAKPYLFEEMGQTMCWARGIINSSGNLLVKLADGGFAAVGKETGKSHLKYGVSVFEAVNDLSRDAPPHYVKSKADAEKLCLLSQIISCKGWSIADVAKNSGVDLSSIKGASLQTLLRAVQGEFSRNLTDLVMPKISPSVLKML